MGLRLSASTHKIVCGTSASLRADAGFAGGWVKLASLTGVNGHKFFGMWNNTGYWGPYLDWNFNGTGNVGFDMDRATTDLKMISTSNALAVGTWYFVGASWDISGADTAQKLYVGALGSDVVEVSSYSTQTVGAGARVATTDAFTIGNTPGGDSWAFLDGDVGGFIYLNRIPQIEEIRRISRQMFAVKDSQLHLELGYHGTGTQTDWSGTGNNGTITGAVAANHPPVLAPFKYTHYESDVYKVSGASAYTLIAGAGSFALTGPAAGLTKQSKLTAAAGSYALTGSGATLAKGFRIAAGAGAYNLTGPAANLLWNRVLPANAGMYLLSGNAANLLRGLKLGAGAGVYLLTGNSANLLKAFRLSSASGAYALTGNAANLLYNRRLAAANGIYILTGNNATLIHGTAGSYTLVAGAGSYDLTGNAAPLLRTHRLSAVNGTYLLTGNNTGLYAGRKLTANAGTYNLTGNAAELRRTYVLVAANGVYLVTGNSANLIFAGSALPTLNYITYIDLGSGITYVDLAESQTRLDIGTGTLYVDMED